MEFINAEIQAYAQEFTSNEDPLLQAVSEYTYANHSHPHMLSGHLQGVFLELISKMIRPSAILEIGSFMGYSTIALAKGLTSEGVLHTIDINLTDIEKAKKHVAEAGFSNKVIFHSKNALEVIPELDVTWDLVFIDADKTGYINYYELVLPQVRKGGVILADNVLFHGEVINKPVSGKNAKAIHAFNEHVKKDERTDKVLLTIRDGVLLIMKK